MNKKILIPLLVVLLVGGYAGYSFALPHKTPKLKVNGTIYVLPKDFTLNMAGGQYATLTVALLLAPSQSVGTTDPNNPPPTGFGSLPEEAVVRAIITNDVTGQPASALISATGRAVLEKKILSDIKSQTDDDITSVYFTDLAVQ
jgi:flagellar basal body-associated protein FliL